MKSPLELRADLLVFGAEPAAFAAASACLEAGFRVLHLLPEPLGLLGASRELGLAHCELGEPWERLLAALGGEHARAYRDSAREGIDRLHALLSSLADGVESATCTRGTRLVLARSRSAGELIVEDALARQQEGEQVRLMSGAAASNYAPVISSEYACLETHCLRFSPVRALAELRSHLESHEGYTAVALEVSRGFERCSLQVRGSGVELSWEGSQGRVRCLAEALLCCAGLASVSLLRRFRRVLIGLQVEAFRTAALRERARTNVVGLTASWGYEQYYFDSQRRLVAAGRDPQGGLAEALVPEVDEEVGTRMVERALELFPDLLPDLVEQHWAYLWTASCDGLPLLGPLPGEPKIWVCEGFGPAAWSRGFRLGEAVGQALAGGESHPLLARCSPKRFQL